MPMPCSTQRKHREAHARAGEHQERAAAPAVNESSTRKDSAGLHAAHDHCGTEHVAARNPCMLQDGAAVVHHCLTSCGLGEEGDADADEDCPEEARGCHNLGKASAAATRCGAKVWAAQLQYCSLCLRRTDDAMQDLFGFVHASLSSQPSRRLQHHAASADNNHKRGYHTEAQHQAPIHGLWQTVTSPTACVAQENANVTQHLQQ
mmetsp:Transcript_27236/g.56520  ORF Transcript_27236/g.56520 Transcript_27236/m.56520 type:complete len:205 (-) Transcript_27236:175-789(-)